ncbi:hypothetical protein [Flindersiella endophytica]
MLDPFVYVDKLPRRVLVVGVTAAILTLLAVGAVFLFGMGD